MEKFSNWRDKGTGISPFIPTSLPKDYIIPKCIIFLFKLPVFLVAVLISFALPIKALIIKFLFNFKINTVDNVKSNSFVVVNYSTPLIGMLLGKGSIVIPNSDGDLYAVSPLQVLGFSFSEDFSNPPGYKVDDVSKLSGPVYCLIEGTPSNCKSVLKFSSINSKYSFDKFTLSTLIVKVSPPYFNLPIPNVSKVAFLFHLLTNLSSKSSISFKLVHHNSWDLNHCKTSFRQSGLNMVNLSVSDKESFYKYYTENT